MKSITLILLIIIIMTCLMGCSGYQLMGIVVLEPISLEIVTEFNGTFFFDGREYNWVYVDSEPSLIRVTEIATDKLTTFVVRNILYFNNY